MIKIIVLGDLNLDVIGQLPTWVPRGGEVRTTIKTRPGGSAANFARSVAQHEGIQVTFIGCVGDDPAGRFLVTALAEQGIEMQVKRAPLPTGTIISLTDGKERTILCSRGANDALDESFIEASWFNDPVHLHLSGYAFLSPGQARAADRAVSLAKEKGMSVSLTAPPANLIRKFGVKDFLAAIAPVDWLFLNYDEGKAITDADIPEEIVDVLAQKFALGALTLGKAGSLAWEGENRDRGVLEPLENADTTGAGDAFAAGFVVNYLKERNLNRANRSGINVAYSLLHGRITPV